MIPRFALSRWFSAPLFALLLTGCPFRTFEVGPSAAPASGGGGGEGGGSGGVARGGSPDGQGGAARKAAPPQAFDDDYFLRQGEVLSVRDNGGVLVNDAPNELVVASYEDAPDAVPDGFDAEFSISQQGALQFKPDPRFFGTYELRYTARNRDGAEDEAVVRVHVAPVAATLDVLSSDVGGIVFEGKERGDRLGTAVCAAGDVDGDGLPDLLAGAPGVAAGAGAAYVVFGRRGLASLDLSGTLTDDAYAAFVGRAGDGLGQTLATQPAPERLLLLGAPEGPGRVYRVAHQRALRGKNTALEADSGAALSGDESTAAVGRLLADAGDVNGDGRRDLVLAHDAGERGVLRVVFGDGLPLSAQALVDAPGIELAAAEGEGFPFAVAGAGDQNGDGLAEVLAASGSSFLLLAGGSEYPPSEAEVSIDGSAWGFRSVRAAPGTSAAVAPVGDLDDDGFQDLAYCDGAIGCRVVKTPPSTLTNGWRVTGFGTSASRLMVAPAGDLDADGIPDIAFAEESQIYVVYGRPAGHADVNVGLLDRAGFRLSMPAGRPVTALAGVGDVNGDRIDDLAIGDADARSGAGRLYVVFGVSSR